MKKAVIIVGNKQYIVSEGMTLDVDYLGDTKKLDLKPILVYDEKSVQVGKPIVENVKVLVEVIDSKKAEKVTSIRFKAKKRVKTIRGHRQLQSVIKINKIL